VAFVPHGLSHAAVQTLNGIGGVDDPAHRGGKGKEGDDLRPVSPPTLGHRRVVGPALLGSLREDQSPQVRWRAAMALSKIADPQLADTLERVLDNE
jgi:HEAT repeat protein